MKRLDNISDKLLLKLGNVQNRLADILEKKFKEAGLDKTLDKLDKNHFHTEDKDT